MLPNRRNRNSWLVAYAWVCLGMCGAALGADRVTVVLGNGDRLTGIVQAETADAVTLETLLGPIKIPLTQIKRRETAANPLPGPGVTGGAIVSTNLTPAAPVTNRAPVMATTNTATLPKGLEQGGHAGTNSLQPGWHLLSQPWMKPLLTNWHGNIQLGMDLGFGTSERRSFYGNATANHTWDRVRNLLEYHVAYGIVNQLESANKMDGSIKTDVDLGPKRRVYVYGHLGAGYDHIRHLDLTFDTGPGVGYKFIDKAKLKLAGEIGAQYQKLNYDNGPGKSFFSARVGENLTWKAWDIVTFTQRLSYLPSVSDPEDYRIRFDLTASYPLFKKITINLNIIDQYESRPTVSVHNNDLEIQSTIGVTF